MAVKQPPKGDHSPADCVPGCFDETRSITVAAKLWRFSDDDLETLRYRLDTNTGPVPGRVFFSALLNRLEAAERVCEAVLSYGKKDVSKFANQWLKAAGK